MIREKRATRGLRMTDLAGEEAERDKAFWEHDVWNDDADSSGNESFEEEEVKPDEFESDFNDTEDDESSSDEETKTRAEIKRNKQAPKNLYREPVKKKANKPSGEPRKSEKRDTSVKVELNSSLQLRHSTKTKSMEHERARKEASRASRPRAPPRILPQREFTQKDLLFESLDTEILNAKWLHSQQMAEEERAQSEKPAKSSSTVNTFLSRRGSYNTITFCEDAWPDIFENSTSPEIPESVCVVTGKRARYRDAATGCPFYDLAALKKIRAGSYNMSF